MSLYNIKNSCRKLIANKNQFHSFGGRGGALIGRAGTAGDLKKKDIDIRIWIMACIIIILNFPNHGEANYARVKLVRIVP